MSFSLRWGLSFEYGCASFEAWLWVVEGLTLERCSTFGKKDKLEPSYVGPFEILGWIGPIVRLKIYVLWAEYRKLDWEFLFDELRVKVRWDSKRGPELTWERKDQMRSRELKRNGNVMVVNCVVKLLLDYFGKLSISDQLEWVLWYAPWLSDQLEWICGMLHGLVINWSSSAIETSRNRVNVFSIITVSFMRILGLREVASTTARIALEFTPEFVYVCCMGFVECYFVLLGPYQLVHVKFGISSWRGSRVDSRSYLQNGAIDGSEANGIIRDPKLELESSRFTFD
ncbi:hypothetical protein Tco_1509735 [Tanacetum coccineum]